jgi:hypothetical protein
MNLDWRPPSRGEVTSRSRRTNPEGRVKGSAKVSHRLMGFEITVRRRGVFEWIGAIDEDIENSFVDPLHHPHSAPAPMINRLAGGIATATAEVHPVGLVPQANGRNVPSSVAIRDEDAL